MQERCSVCSRCETVRYCNRECLVAAWVAPDLPHKLLCKKIAAFRAAIGLVGDKDWSHCSRGNFAETCVEMGADPLIAEEIYREIYSLKNEKMKFAAAQEIGEQHDTDTTVVDEGYLNVSVSRVEAAEIAYEPFPEEEVD
ncbi:hypothetical protein B0H17DRAFT_1099055 [Mycena rosella]|uniref:MYND-type domain-containing protein n=1 Tax=Mycena rosella TaxID=1033263 RepID=A0AAD7CNU3_MYCRO|nr:hypothetical protein B0H17DRAFT_1099055 [Mycena rosella]